MSITGLPCMFMIYKLNVNKIAFEEKKLVFYTIADFKHTDIMKTDQVVSCKDMIKSYLALKTNIMMSLNMMKFGKKTCLNLYVLLKHDEIFVWQVSTRMFYKYIVVNLVLFDHLKFTCNNGRL